jgi:hypothetical protein
VTHHWLAVVMVIWMAAVVLGLGAIVVTVLWASWGFAG